MSQVPGPDELATKNIVGYCPLDNGGHFFIGPSNDCYVFNQYFKKNHFFVLNRSNYGTEPSYDSPFYYTLSYPKLILRNYKDKVYTNVYCEHPQLHMFSSYNEYIEGAHYIASVGLLDGAMDSVYGNYPKTYEAGNTKQFTLVNYDVDKDGNFYVSFEADSLVYMYDNAFNPLVAFGYDGKEMDKDYAVLHSVKDFRMRNMDEREKRSYYTWVEYIDERDLLFRSYRKAQASPADGLQIYHKHVLVGDVNVPKGFKVMGYSAPYFYASVPIDEENEKITFYKFKLSI